MADNVQKYGIRWAKGYNGGRDVPQPVECFVASGQAFNINGGSSGINLSIGDPVTRLASGAVTLCDGSEGASGGVAIYGIVVGIQPYYDSTIGNSGALRPSNVLPSSIAYGTNLERQSKVLVVPVGNDVFEVDCDDAVTATTEAAYQALIGNNADHALTTATSTKAYPRLDISSAGTATAQWRIVGISKTADNQDFSGNYVKLLVICNEPQDPSASATGI
jgi:hypothetical protein